jgi:hypothetical protein
MVRYTRWSRVVLLVSLVWPIGAYAGELSQKFLDIYSKGAFATTAQLVKFGQVPTLSVFCADDTCRPIVQRLESVLSDVVPVQQTASENTGANIEILFYPNEEARRRSVNQYTAKVGEVASKSVHESCGVVQFRRGFEVVKVIVVATEDAGPRANLVCILNETLRGSGFTVQRRYPDYVGSYLELDDPKFAVVLKGFSLLFAMQFSKATKAGQDRATVEEALRQSFTITY